MRRAKLEKNSKIVFVWRQNFARRMNNTSRKVPLRDVGLRRAKLRCAKCLRDVCCFGSRKPCLRDEIWSVVQDSVAQTCFSTSVGMIDLCKEEV